MRLLNKFTICCCLLLFGSIVFPIKVTAAGVAENVSLSPIVSDDNALPGELLQASFKLTNNTSKSTQLKITGVEFVPKEGDQLDITEESTLAALIVLSSTEIELMPGESFEVKASLPIPTEISDGDYYLGIKVNLGAASNETLSGSRTGIETNLIFRWNINVANKQLGDSVLVKDLKSTPLIVWSDMSIDYAVQNQLAQFAKPILYLQIVDPYQKPIWRSIINDSMKLLKGYDSLSGKETAPKDLFGVLGQYTVELLVVDRQLNRTDIKKITFWVVPPTVIAAGVIIPGIALLIGRKFSQKRKVFKQRRETYK